MQKAEKRMLQRGKLFMKKANERFVEKLKRKENVQDYFEIVNKWLKIQPNTFFQMTVEERTKLLEQSKDMKKER